MLRKKEVYTNITPLPPHIPRQLAVDILHSHGEIITLNPLVTDYKPIQAPRDAAADEFYSTWYEITERIQYIPGMGKAGSGTIRFRGCFHDVPWGLQTHIYAPAGVDMRNNWKVAGNEPGEPPETRELGIGAPSEGLYIREDIEIKCNITMVSFVKSQLKAATKILVDRLIKKAEMLDSGQLHGMIEDGKLKTINPADRSKTMQMPAHLGQQQPPPLSPGQTPYNIPRSPSYRAQQPGVYSPQRSPSHLSQHQQQGQQQFAMELPGDFHYNTAPQSQPHLSPNLAHHRTSGQDHRASSMSGVSEASSYSSDHRASYQQSLGSANSRPTSLSSEGGLGPMRSPGLDQKQFAEMPTMSETREEHREKPDAEKHGYPDALKISSRASNGGLRQDQQQGQQQQQTQYPYNPSDYAAYAKPQERPPPQYQLQQTTSHNTTASGR